MKFLVRLLISLSVIVYVMSTSYFFGEKTSDTKLINREKVIRYAVPWKYREGSYTFNDTLQRPIKAIDCHDYQRTEATVNITSGGIGYPYVEMQFKSQRSYGLEYAIEIFA